MEIPGASAELPPFCKRKIGFQMGKHSHRFVEEYDGLVGFGYSREINELTVTYYLQKFSDDELMAVLRERMTDADLEAAFEFVSGMLKKYLSEEEYHRYFLGDVH